jgi:hypothetical protein
MFSFANFCCLNDYLANWIEMMRCFSSPSQDFSLHRLWTPQHRHKINQKKFAAVFKLCCNGFWPLDNVRRIFQNSLLYESHKLSAGVLGDRWNHMQTAAYLIVLAHDCHYMAYYRYLQTYSIILKLIALVWCRSTFVLPLYLAINQ